VKAAMKHELDLTVVIPVYNEEETICDVIRSIKRALNEHNISHELIVVNDGSTDLTNRKLKEIASHETICVIEHEKRKGKGAAFLSALKRSRGKYIAIFDADMEYDAWDLVRMYKHVKSNGFDACIGSRFKGSICRMTLSHRVGNIILSKLASIFFGVSISDVMSGLKLASADLLKATEGWSQGFTFEIDFVWNIVKRNARLVEIPIRYVRRHKGKSKISFIDGIMSAIWIFKRRLIGGLNDK